VTVTIGRLRWWHIDALAPIEADLFGAERWSAAMFWNELANGHYYVVALESERSGSPGEAPGAGMFGGEVVGYAGLSVGAGEGWVQNVAVRRDRQRRGIGRALLEALLAEADRRQVKAVLLEVAVDNRPAQKLYDSYGFAPVGVRRGYYQPSNTDALVMRRDA
jgi:[ribosomal protein S18]-alanine N-acetyltransferase